MNQHQLATTLRSTFLYAAAYSATHTPSDGQDLQGMVNPTVIATFGAVPSVSPACSWALKISESDTSNSGFTTVAAADLVCSANCDAVSGGVVKTVAHGSGDSDVYRITYKGTKQYLLVEAVATNGTATPIAVQIEDQPSITPVPTTPS